MELPETGNSHGSDKETQVPTGSHHRRPARRATKDRPPPPRGVPREETKPRIPSRSPPYDSSLPPQDKRRAAKPTRPPETALARPFCGPVERAAKSGVRRTVQLRATERGKPSRSKTRPRGRSAKHLPPRLPPKGRSGPKRSPRGRHRPVSKEVGNPRPRCDSGRTKPMVTKTPRKSPRANYNPIFQ